MTRYLVDTHVWYWWLFSESSLKVHHIRKLEQWQREGVLYLSAISAWEASQKQSSGKLTFDGRIEDWLDATLRPGAMTLQSLDLPILLEANRLPEFNHGDPADRILAASARLHDLTLVTRDERLLDYGASGHLKTYAV